MKQRTKKIVFILVLVIVCYFCFRSYRIGTQAWKYSEDAALLGDIAEFDFKIISIFNNQLYSNGVPVAILVNYQYRIMDDVIVVESIDGKWVGKYCSK
jgi:hypothetical protein